MTGFFSWHFFPHIKGIIAEPELLRNKLLAYGNWSRMVFVGLQILQVVVAPLPGELVQIAGGFIFSFWSGTIYSLAGIFVGSCIAFYLSRWLGYPLLQALTRQETLEKFKFLLESNRAEVLIFILFLIPGVPKDILTFIAGMTPVRPTAFFSAAMLGRFPGIVVCSIIGAQLGKQQYFFTLMISLLAAVILLLAFIYRDRLIQLLKHHHRQ